MNVRQDDEGNFVIGFDLSELGFKKDFWYLLCDLELMRRNKFRSESNILIEVMKEVAYRFSKVLEEEEKKRYGR